MTPGIQTIPLILLLFLATIVGNGIAPPIEYKITINPADLSGLDVQLLVTGARANTRIAMAVHPEYDDRYWRYIEGFSVTDVRGRKPRFSKEEDTVWRIENTSGVLLVRYRVRLPVQEAGRRDAWKPFLTEHGGMVGDLHTLMYVVGRESDRALVKLDMPVGWKAASGLEPTRDPRVFAGSAALMMDSPIMIGNLTEHDFRASGVPHKIVFWSEPNGPAFDANAIVTNVKKLADETIRAFGRPPYPRYVFLFQNGGQAALEHATSVNLGLSSLSMEDLLEEVAHEYIHVWNLMDVRPRERIGVRFRFAEPTNVLWFSEGATIMFSDLLIRRARLPGESRTRLQRLESMITRYLSSPGYYTLSAEHVSRGDSHPILLGNSFASTHLQGEVLSVMLDLKIRDVTDGRRTLADVMRLLSQRFNSGRGIANSDIERAIADVCRCDIRPFFNEYIYNAKKVDFDQYLGLMGIRAEIGTVAAANRDGSPAPDLRIGPISGQGELKLRILNSESVWARAGLNTGDTVVSIDGSSVTTWPALRQWMQRAKMGDVARVVVTRDGLEKRFEVRVTGYTIPTVRLIEQPTPTAKQMRIRNAWYGAV